MVFGHVLDDLLVAHVAEGVHRLAVDQRVGELRLAHRFEHHAGEHRLELLRGLVEVLLGRGPRQPRIEPGLAGDRPNRVAHYSTTSSALSAPASLSASRIATRSAG